METIAKILEFQRLRRNAQMRPKDLAALRLRKLRAVVCHAGSRAPFYRSLWRSAGVKPGDLHSLEDLVRFPIVTKAMLKKAGDLTLAEGVRREECVLIRTSGTTGDAFELAVTRDELRMRRLIEFRTLLAMGFRPRDRLAIVGPGKGRPPNWHERLGLYRTRIFTAELSPAEHIERLREMRPTILWSYPDPLHAIVHALDYRLSRIVRPRIIITSGRNLLPFLKERILADLDCEMFNSYAAMETGRLAAECQEHNGLHVNADHVIVECVKAPEGGRAVVVTALNAYAMPFIRYHLGDVSEELEGACPCGSAFPRIAAPVGRHDDMMALPSGRLQAAFRLQSGMRDFPDIDQFRFIQEAPDRLVTLIVPRGAWNEERSDALRRMILERTGEPIMVEIRTVHFMPPVGGKFQNFVSMLPAEQRGAAAPSGAGSDRVR